MNERPTPETTAAIMESRGAWSFGLRHKMEQLERERDEARRNAEVERLSGVAVVAVCKRQESEIEAMREAIEAAHEMITEHVEALDWPALNARKLTTALAKLQPFLA